MSLTPEEQALLDARRAMLVAGDALDAAYAALRSAIALGEPGTIREINVTSYEFDRACRTYDNAFRAAYDQRKP